MEQRAIADEFILNMWRMMLSHFVASERKLGMDKKLFALNVRFLCEKLIPRTPRHLVDKLMVEFPVLLTPREANALEVEDIGDV